MATQHTWSARTRLTVIAVGIAVLLGLILTVVATLSLYGLADRFRAREVGNATLETIDLTVRGHPPPVLPEASLAGIQVLNPRGQVVSSTANLRGAPRMAEFAPPPGTVRTASQSCSIPAFPGRCMVVVAFRIQQPDGAWIVYSAADVVPWYVHPGLFAVIVGAYLLLVTVVGLGVYHTATRVLAPVNAIRDELAEITASDLGRRVPVPSGWDEIRGLALTINQTLDRLDAAAEQQRRFAADASHDLRSPLTAMRAQVEEALHYPEDADWKTKAHEMLTSLNRLEAIISDLLMLARLDSGVPASREPIDLRELCEEELGRHRRRVEVIRALEPGVTVTGDRLQLARLLTNLMDNAERHTASRITVSVAAHGDTAVLEVLDDGAGIARDQWEVVFRRFTRLDAARNRDAGGTGLGLPIAREVAESHGGTLGLEESTRGARFVLRLPLAR